MSSTPEQVQDRVAGALREYVDMISEGGVFFPPFRDDHELTRTVAAVSASEILKAAQIELFELQMWRALGT